VVGKVGWRRLTSPLRKKDAGVTDDGTSTEAETEAETEEV
jgi:hypothetical protein